MELHRVVFRVVGKTLQPERHKTEAGVLKVSKSNAKGPQKPSKGLCQDAPSTISLEVLLEVLEQGLAPQLSDGVIYDFRVLFGNRPGAPHELRVVHRWWTPPAISSYGCEARQGMGHCSTSKHCAVLIVRLRLVLQTDYAPFVLSAPLLDHHAKDGRVRVVRKTDCYDPVGEVIISLHSGVERPHDQSFHSMDAGPYLEM